MDLLDRPDLPARRSPSVLLAAAVALPPALCAGLGAARSEVSAPNAVLALVLLVVAVAAGGSRLAGVVAALSSALWFDFFLLDPVLRFTIDDRDDVETAVLLTLVGVAVTELVLWGRRQQGRASERGGYLAGLVRTAGLVAAGQTPPSVVLDLVSRQILEVLPVDRCTWAAGPGSGPRPRIEPDGSVRREGRILDVDRSGLPTDDVVELPVRHGGLVVGRFVLTASTRVVWTTVEQRLVAVTLADQAAAVLTPPAPSRSAPSGPAAG